MKKIVALSLMAMVSVSCIADGFECTDNLEKNERTCIYEYRDLIKEVLLKKDGENHYSLLKEIIKYRKGDGTVIPAQFEDTVKQYVIKYYEGDIQEKYQYKPTVIPWYDTLLYQGKKQTFERPTNKNVVGEKTEYYPNGQLKVKSFYNENSEKDGEYFQYDRNGNITDHYIYKNGKVVKVIK